MGIEYTHYLVVTDLDWTPTKVRAEAAHQVLVRWGLATGKPELHEVVRKPGAPRAKARKVRGASIERSGRLPDELVMLYPGADGPAVERLLGPARYCGRGDAFAPSVWGVELVLGRDFKVLTATDFGPIFTELEDDSDRYEWSGLHASWDAVAWSSEPPGTRVQARHQGDGRPLEVPRGFRGLWRSGLLLSCGKAHPAFTHAGSPLDGLPERGFVRDLERALETRVVEAGVFS